MKPYRNTKIRNRETVACGEDDMAVRDGCEKLIQPLSTNTGQYHAKRSPTEDFTHFLTSNLRTHSHGTSSEASSETLSVERGETTILSTNELEIESNLATLITRTTIFTTWSPLSPSPPTDTQQSSEDEALSTLFSTTVTTTSVATSTSLPPSSQMSLSTGTTVGIAVGVILFCLFALLSIIFCRRFVNRNQRGSSSQPFDKRLIGYPYPTPHLSQSLSSPMRDVQPRPCMIQRRSFTMNTGDKKFDGQNNGRMREETLQQINSQAKYPQDMSCLACESSALETENVKNGGSRDTIGDILAAYSSGSEYSQDVTKKNDGTSSINQF